MDQFLEDMWARLKAAQGLSNTAAPTIAAPKGIVSLGEALETAIPDHIRRHKVFTDVVERTITKLIRTPDLGTLRVASVSDRMAVRRNRQTPFLNYLESQGEPAIVNDYQ